MNELTQEHHYNKQTLKKHEKPSNILIKKYFCDIENSAVVFYSSFL